MAEYINKADIVKLINDSFFDLGVSDDRTNMLTEVEELPSVTIKDTADKIKVTNCNDNISRQALCDALDKTFADRIKMFDYDSYEKADEKTQLVCDGIMKAIDVVLGLPSAQPEPEEFEWCHDCKEYDQAQHCCHRWTKVIRQTVEEIKAEQPEPKTGKWIYHSDWEADGECGYECSECGMGSDVDYAYCMRCGAKMEGR